MIKNLFSEGDKTGRVKACANNQAGVKVGNGIGLDTRAE